MGTYFFEIEITPTAGARGASHLAGASALIFVIAGSPDQAQTQARSAIMDHGWQVEAVSLALQPTAEQIAGLGTDIQALHRQALAHGIAFLLVANPIKSGDQDDPVQIYSLGDPLLDPSKKH